MNKQADYQWHFFISLTEGKLGNQSSKDFPYSRKEEKDSLTVENNQTGVDLLNAKVLTNTW